MEQEGHQAPAPRAAPRDLQAGDMGHCWGGRLAAPPRPSHTGLAPRTIRRGPLGTVGAWQQQGCPCQGLLLATLPGAGSTPKPHPPRMEALPCSPPPTTPQPRASCGTSRVLPGAPGPCAPREGQCPGRRPPEAAPGARHTHERVGGPGGLEQGRWGVGGEAGGSGGSPGSWLSRLPSAPPGEAVVRLRVAVVTLAGNHHFFCWETVVQRALCESPGRAGRVGSLIRASLCGPRGRAPNPDSASVSPRQGALSVEGPFPPPGCAGTPIFPLQPLTPRAQGTGPCGAPGPNRSGEGHACPTPRR